METDSIEDMSKSLKQGTLFSFFSKKPKPCAADANDAASSAASAAAKASDAKNINNKSHVGSNTTTSTSSSAVAEPCLSSIVVGTRIEVYWPDDDEYYVATVTVIQQATPNMIYTLRYDDGEVETLDLSRETWRIASSQKKPSEISRKDNDKRRIIVEREGEETDEYEFLADASDEEDTGDENGDDDDDYEHSVEEDDTEHDSEMDDEFLVDSEEDEDNKRGRARSRLTEESKDTGGKRKRLVKVSPKVTGSATKAAKEANPSKRARKAVTPPPANNAMTHFAATSSGKSNSFITAISQNDEEKKTSDSDGAANFLSPVFQRFANNAKKHDNDNAVGKTVSRTVSSINKGKALVTPPPSSLSASSSSLTNKSMETSNAAIAVAEDGIPATGMFQDGAVNPAGTHVHNHLTFLYPPKLRDANGNLSTSPAYDPRTLKFGSAEEAEILKLTGGGKSLTPASKQWWDIKSKYFDTVLFFKTGKFYELYNMDADVGCKELGFVYMKGAIAHSGFPESAYGVMSGKLIERGFKVARVEQTETPEQLAERKKKCKTGKKPQVVNREVS